MRIAQGSCALNRPTLVKHLPGHSIVPGVVLLNEVLLAVEHHDGISMASYSWPAVHLSRRSARVNSSTSTLELKTGID